MKDIVTGASLMAIGILGFFCAIGAMQRINSGEKGVSVMAGFLFALALAITGGASGCGMWIRGVIR